MPERRDGCTSCSEGNLLLFISKVNRGDSDIVKRRIRAINARREPIPITNRHMLSKVALAVS